ncbi:uncharacterized protein LOC121875793 [Homarus americanus]|uniref:Uncharacterized protein n=1 Tax=Homarus americanus TaxID=6706 RepID=A0A8J5NBA1_HOMAM|nr:uncharacterized protein LOC121875793 [Homarus americanus]KAG7176437.1 hypothetical protein Hamer_G021266 [Homarus americanus]
MAVEQDVILLLNHNYLFSNFDQHAADWNAPSLLKVYQRLLSVYDSTFDYDGDPASSTSHQCFVHIQKCLRLLGIDHLAPKIKDLTDKSKALRIISAIDDKITGRYNKQLAARRNRIVIKKEQANKAPKVKYLTVSTVNTNQENVDPGVTCVKSEEQEANKVSEVKHHQVSTETTNQENFEPSATCVKESVSPCRETPTLYSRIDITTQEKWLLETKTSSSSTSPEENIIPFIPTGRQLPRTPVKSSNISDMENQSFYEDKKNTFLTPADKVCDNSLSDSEFSSQQGTHSYLTPTDKRILDSTMSDEESPQEATQSPTSDVESNFIPSGRQLSRTPNKLAEIDCCTEKNGCMNFTLGSSVLGDVDCSPEKYRSKQASSASNEISLESSFNSNVIIREKSQVKESSVDERTSQFSDFKNKGLKLGDVQHTTVVYSSPQVSSDQTFILTSADESCTFSPPVIYKDIQTLPITILESPVGIKNHTNVFIEANNTGSSQQELKVSPVLDKCNIDISLHSPDLLKTDILYEQPLPGTLSGFYCKTLVDYSVHESSASGYSEPVSRHSLIDLGNYTSSSEAYQEKDSEICLLKGKTVQEDHLGVDEDISKKSFILVSKDNSELGLLDESAALSVTHQNIPHIDCVLTPPVGFMDVKATSEDQLESCDTEDNSTQDKNSIDTSVEAINTKQLFVSHGEPKLRISSVLNEIKNMEIDGTEVSVSPEQEKLTATQNTKTKVSLREKLANKKTSKVTRGVNEEKNLGVSHQETKTTGKQCNKKVEQITTKFSEALDAPTKNLKSPQNPSMNNEKLTWINDTFTLLDFDDSMEIFPVRESRKKDKNKTKIQEGTKDSSGVIRGTSKNSIKTEFAGAINKDANTPAKKLSLQKQKAKPFSDHLQKPTKSDFGNTHRFVEDEIGSLVDEVQHVTKDKKVHKENKKPQRDTRQESVKHSKLKSGKYDHAPILEEIKPDNMKDNKKVNHNCEKTIKTGIPVLVDPNKDSTKQNTRETKLATFSESVKASEVNCDMGTLKTKLARKNVKKITKDLLLYHKDSEDHINNSDIEITKSRKPTDSNAYHNESSNNMILLESARGFRSRGRTKKSKSTIASSDTVESCSDVSIERKEVKDSEAGIKQRTKSKLKDPEPHTDDLLCSETKNSTKKNSGKAQRKILQFTSQIPEPTSATKLVKSTSEIHSVSQNCSKKLVSRSNSEQTLNASTDKIRDSEPSEKPIADSKKISCQIQIKEVDTHIDQKDKKAVRYKTTSNKKGGKKYRNLEKSLPVHATSKVDEEFCMNLELMSLQSCESVEPQASNENTYVSNASECINTRLGQKKAKFNSEQSLEISNVLLQNKVSAQLQLLSLQPTERINSEGLKEAEKFNEKRNRIKIRADLNTNAVEMLPSFIQKRKTLGTNRNKSSTSEGKAPGQETLSSDQDLAMMQEKSSEEKGVPDTPTPTSKKRKEKYEGYEKESMMIDRVNSDLSSTEDTKIKNKKVNGKKKSTKGNKDFHEESTCESSRYSTTRPGRRCKTKALTAISEIFNESDSDFLHHIKAKK